MKLYRPIVIPIVPVTLTVNVDFMVVTVKTPSGKTLIIEEIEIGVVGCGATDPQITYRWGVADALGTTGHTITPFLFNGDAGGSIGTTAKDASVAFTSTVPTIANGAPSPLFPQWTYNPRKIRGFTLAVDTVLGITVNTGLGGSATVKAVGTIFASEEI